MNADCDKIHLVKETLFRKFDVNPLDGVLSLDEVRAAFSAHDVDTGYLEHVAKTTTDFSDQGGILLSKIIQSGAFRLDVFQSTPKQTRPNQRRFTFVAQPTQLREPEKRRPRRNVKPKKDWFQFPGTIPRYRAILTISRGVADGRLYEKFNGAAVRTLTDIRPAVGTGDSKVTLVAQLTFDDNDTPFMSTQGNNGYSGERVEKRFSIEACGDGIKCAKRKNNGFSQFMYGTRRALSSSGIMMWFLLDASTEQKSGGSLFLRETRMMELTSTE